MKNLYEILGVTPEANQEEITKAVRSIRKKLHPDQNPDTTAEDREFLIEAEKAYEVLGDPSRRRDYDGNNEYRLLTEGYTEEHINIVKTAILTVLQRHALGLGVTAAVEEVKRGIRRCIDQNKDIKASAEREIARLRLALGKVKTTNSVNLFEIVLNDLMKAKERDAINAGLAAETFEKAYELVKPLVEETNLLETEVKSPVPPQVPTFSSSWFIDGHGNRIK